MAKFITKYFPLEAIVLSCFALAFPHFFTPMKGWINYLLGIVMFGMGITLTLQDFIGVIRRPLVILIGVLLQFLLMPLIGWALYKVFHLPPQLAVGVILVGCCPGGTASNVISYLAKADVALSITVTSITTLLAFVMTPLLTLIYAGRIVTVPFLSMLISILEIVIVPVALGLLVSSLFGKTVDRVKDLFPAVSVLFIILIIAIIMGVNSRSVLQSGLVVLLVVVIHNLMGLTSAYGISRACRISQREARTIAIEVAMQNSGLGVTLAVKYFSVAAALPGAIFSIWQNISGSIAAAFWARQESNEHTMDHLLEDSSLRSE